MSADLQWLLLRKSNSFIVKRTVEGPIFSSEPGNLRNIHSFKYSGLANLKTVAITPSTETGGLTLSTRIIGANPRHVKKAIRSVALKGNAGQRRVAKIIAVETAAKGYRPDLRT
ncbi:ribosomal L28e/Mak16 [Mrakia frigida]|uniref:ribosomal L28e/Mak16 n=1 Tax=Mrakia frigida TaxID=29902 RepID=UPI003FCC1997